MSCLLPASRTAAFAALAALAATGLMLAAPAAAGPLQAVSGTFLNDDEVASVALNASASGHLLIRSTSYAGGGFAPVLSLFDAAGMLLTVDRGSSHACAQPSVGFCWDAVLDLQLPLGAYTLTLTQDGNDALGPTLADGFQQTGRPTYTGTDWLGDPDRRFIQVDGTQRSGDWALEWQEFAVEGRLPLPSSLALMLSALLALGLAHRRPQPQSDRLPDDGAGLAG